MNHSDLTNLVKHLPAVYRGLARQIVAHPPSLFPRDNDAATPVFFASQVAWDSVWQRPQEQALGLSEHHPVVYFSPVQIHEAAGRFAENWRPLRRLQGGRLTVLSPVIFSGEYRLEAARRLNRRLVERLLAEARGLQDRLIYLTNTPFPPIDFRSFHPRIVGYDLIDDFCAFEWAPANARSREEALLRRADLGFAGTGFLMEKYRRRLPGLEFLPSGVHFGKLTHPREEPADMARLPRPRALYVGTLNDRLNAGLFKTVAQANPDGSVVVVGPRHGSFRPPELPKNVHFFGLRPHAALASYYQHADLGLMPFADTPAARATNPVKTLEYLSCGLPVLSTPIPDVEKYYPEVVRVERPERWGQALKEMLREDSEESRRKRREFARHRSWETLVERMEERFQEEIAKTGNRPKDVPHGAIR